MTNEIRAAFQNCDVHGCHEIRNNNVINIIEPHGGMCYIDNQNANPNFVVLNPNSKNINYLAIDQCIFFDENHRRCDCAVYDDTVFCFVEIKDTNTQKANRRSKHLSKAYTQLEQTIQIFKAQLAFAGYTLEATIAFKEKPARPMANASNQYWRVRFLQQYAVELNVGNSKTFT